MSQIPAIKRLERPITQAGRVVKKAIASPKTSWRLSFAPIVKNEPRNANHPQSPPTIPNPKTTKLISLFRRSPDTNTEYKRG